MKRLIALLLILCLCLSGCVTVRPGSSQGDPVIPPTSTLPADPTPADPTDPTVPTIPAGTEPTDPTVPTIPAGTEPTVPAGTDSTVPPAPKPTAPSVSEPTAPSIPAPTVPPTTEATAPPVTDPPAPKPTTPPAPKPTVPPTTAPTVPVPTIPAPTAPPVTDPPATTPPPTQPPVVQPVSKAEPQGLKTLQGKGNANLITAYDRLVAGVEAASTEIQLRDLSLSVDTLEMVYECYRNDYPQHFWLGNSYRYSYSGSTIHALQPQYLMTGSQLSSARSQFDAKVNAILAKLSPGMSEYEKELIIHDALVTGCTYLDGTYAHSAYGALVVGQAVCEGYARAFRYLLFRADITCMAVTGNAGGPHAWTAVKIGGDWYYTDPTWDDPTGRPDDAPIRYAYFNLTRAQMDEDHTADAGVIPLPAATATRYNYHVVNGSMTAGYDLKLAELFRNSDQVRLYVTGDMDRFLQDFQANAGQLIQAAGRTDCRSYSYEIVGREVMITLIRA